MIQECIRRAMIEHGERCSVTREGVVWGMGPASLNPLQENPAGTFLFCLSSLQEKVLS
jgi:hypothetical protein